VNGASVEPRTGLTTGTCAAAAAGAAAAALAGQAPGSVAVELPAGETVTLEVAWLERPAPERARAGVVKDAGDDLDVTDGVTVVAEVERLEGAGLELTFAAGSGVGTVTRAGLQLAVGEPAINPVPRAMIAAAVRAALPHGRLRVTIAVPGGDALAARTFNARLGVAGGLSVLGTSGRVIPKSEEAWLRSLLPQVDVAVAAGERTVYLTPGQFGERAARESFAAAETAIVQCANFVGEVLDHCVAAGVERVVLVGHAGKLVKVAAGIWNTHSRFGDARLETLAALAGAAGAPPTLICRLLELPTVQAAIEPLAAAGLTCVWDDVAQRAAQRAAARVAGRAASAGHDSPCVECAVVGYGAEVLGRSVGLRAARSATPPGALSGAPPGAPATVSGAPASATGAPVALEIVVVGVGPGAEEWLTPAAWRRIRGAELIAGGRRQLARFAPAGTRQLAMGGDVAAFAAALRAHPGERVVVLASGDPGLFGIAASLRRLLPEARLTTVPGISSAQLALARLGRPWHDVAFASAHGIGVEAVLGVVRAHPRVVVLTDGRATAQAIAAALTADGCSVEMTVLERLGEPDERITHGSPETLAAAAFDGLAVVFIERDASRSGAASARGER
jgi:cobalt-precorrin-5B (C1)-methyltransferase